MLAMTPNMLGAYGEWAAQSMADPPRLSFRQPMFNNLDAWRAVARARFLEALHSPGGAATPVPVVQHQLEFDGLSIEHMQWQLPFGPPTEALLLKPLGARGKLPGIIGLHDHGGNKYFGLRKITRMSKDSHPAMLRHQEQYYSGMAWANELARRGYVTMVFDALCFNERQDTTGKLKDGDYERCEAMYRITEGKSLQGKYVWDARRALDYLETRPEVDVSRLGMIGHSLGGQETLFTTAIDTRIRAAVSSCGFGSLGTLKRDRINHNYALFVPALANNGDYGAVLALAAPRPFLVIARTEDPIFPKDGIEETLTLARRAYLAAGAADRLTTFFEAGVHEFSPTMREAAYAWLDRWLAPTQ